ncbi:hypothetical protein H310_01813 [Aphanomyces invadans]|uniref:Chromo domain-containing protein n=1 Tax=Aphanomyces invadans TaxID=157072 RepID=A0A024ULS1_9STRA|nr:hypothetical protein H310_01813 [Aphanomyces invadans]ETW07249.1 hypothetical protein H310_01813 [Aphanomyces invadans]|eukprot:XP_008863342.1 hypothetical protein H310_01813 [Aphanomyces invadans]
MKNSDKSNSIECRATLDDVLVQPRVLLYSGSDESLESNGLLQALERLGSRPSVVDKPFVKLKPFGVNSLSLKINLLIGQPVMERLGFSLDDMLVDALMKCQTREVGDLGDGEDKPRTFQRLQEMYGDDAEELDVACSTLSMEKTADPYGQIRRILDEKIAEAMERGLTDAQAMELRRILTHHIDVFRLEFGRDLPVDVEPLMVRLKEGAVPVKTSLRRYPPAHMDYLKKHTDQRVDSLDAMADAELGRSHGNAGRSEGVFTLDWLKGYWHLALHPACQLWYSFITPFGLYTSTRILMGQTGFRLKLHPRKCDFFLKEAKWCGKRRQQLAPSYSSSCAPRTDAHVDPGVCEFGCSQRGLLDFAAKAAGGSKKTALAKIKLDVIGWAAEHDECNAAVETTLQHTVPLSHPSSGKVICLYTDASETHWGAANTQIPPRDLGLPVDDQGHEPLAEAFAIVESCKRLEYLLLRQQGFRLFTDHQNLLHKFNMARYHAHKLKWWAMVMTTFPFGSLWGVAPLPAQVARVRQLVVASPLQAEDFEWPTAAKILGLQREATENSGEEHPNVTWSEENGLYVTTASKIWVPDKAVDLHHCLSRTVEVVNSFVKRELKALLSEMKLRLDEWYRVLPLGQSALNHQSADRLGGVSPVTTFQVLPSTPPIAGFVHPRTKEVVTVDWLPSTGKKHMAELRQALDDMHRYVAQLVEPYKTALHHTSRLKFIRVDDLEVTNDLVDYAAFGEAGFYVEALLAARCNEGRHEVLVKWKGFEAEASWEPASQLCEDIAVVMRCCIVKNDDKQEIKALRAPIEETIGHSLLEGEVFWVPRTVV